jgi:hypothetical protein
VAARRAACLSTEAPKVIAVANQVRTSVRLAFKRLNVFRLIDVLTQVSLAIQSEPNKTSPDAGFHCVSPNILLKACLKACQSTRRHPVYLYFICLIYVSVACILALVSLKIEHVLTSPQKP